MLTRDAYSSGHLVPSHLGLACVLLVETNHFPELIFFSDYSLRTSLGTFSILLYSLRPFSSDCLNASFRIPHPCLMISDVSDQKSIYAFSMTCYTEMLYILLTFSRWIECHTFHHNVYKLTFSVTCRYFSGLCYSNIPRYFLDFASEPFPLIPSRFFSFLRHICLLLSDSSNPKYNPFPRHFPIDNRYVSPQSLCCHLMVLVQSLFTFSYPSPLFVSTFSLVSRPPMYGTFRVYESTSTFTLSVWLYQCHMMNRV